MRFMDGEMGDGGSSPNSRTLVKVTDSGAAITHQNSTVLRRCFREFFAVSAFNFAKFVEIVVVGAGARYSVGAHRQKCVVTYQINKPSDQVMCVDTITVGHKKRWKGA
jgi:hypothetical protein